MLNRREIAAGALCAAALGGVLHPSITALAAAGAVRIEVAGAITPTCSSSVASVQFDAGDVTKAGSSKFSFTVNCNAPFHYTMQSDNGAMRLVNPSASAPISQIEAPYDVHIRIPLTQGGAIDDTCASAALKQGAVSCQFTNSGRGIAVNQTAQAQISWKAAQGILAPGQYSDRLTFSVGLQP